MHVQLWGRLGGLFRKKSGKEMRLGQEENEFVYNEELGVWHEKGKPPSQNQRDTIAPPPILSRSSSAPMSAPGSAPFPNSGPLPGSAPPPSGGNQFTRFSSPARGRYVDTFNTNPTVAPTSTPTVSLPSPSPLGVGQSTNPPAFNVFTPPGTPSNPQAYASPSHSFRGSSSHACVMRALLQVFVLPAVLGPEHMYTCLEYSIRTS